ncbi:MAG: glycosyltransferase family 2 protein [Candidatus Bathyarchaeia archaeon]
MLLSFLTVAIMITLYAIAFVSYTVSYLEELLFDPSSLAFIPLRPQMLFFKSIGPFIFLLLTPLSLTIGFAIWILFSLKRWQGKNNQLKEDEIKNPKICVALTAYNDEEPIYDAVKDFLYQRNVIKVIVVDNNSTDQTAKRAIDAGAHVVHENRQGYGWACIRGLKEALKCEDANIIALCEGDRTFRSYDLQKMVPYLDNVDMVVGTRTTQELLAKKSQLDWFHVWGNLFLAKLIQIKFWDVKHWGRVRLTDVGCTFRVIRREALEKIIDDLKVGGYHFSPHMIMVALNKGLKVIEVPITFRERVGKSKGAGSNKKKAIAIGLKMLWHILIY